MPTENDLRDALGSLERHAPDPAAVLPPAARRGVGRRTLLTGATGLAAVAVPVGTGLLTGRHGPAVTPPATTIRTSSRPASRPAPTGPPHPLEFGFTVEPPPELVLSGLFPTQPGGQVMHLRSRDGTGAAAVYRPVPGTLDPSVLPTGDPVTVNGVSGYYVAEPLPVPVAGHQAPEGVFLEYAPGTWVFAVRTGLTGDRSDPEVARTRREQTLRLAEGIRFGRAAPLRLPYRLGTRPDWMHVSLGQLDAEAPSTVVVLVHLTGPVAGSELQLRASPVAAAARFLDRPFLEAPRGEPTTVDATPFRPRVGAGFGSFVVEVLARTPSNVWDDIPTALMLDVLRTLTPAADFDDQDTWFDPADAVPA
ncbi:MAG TPA: hypothetical protein VGD67_24930 [Pseudonocardiaceae bacterium]